MGIIVYIDRQIAGIRFSKSRLKKLVKAVCRKFDVINAVINITITGNAQIRRLNRKFLNCSHNTDCLSFDLSEAGASRLFVFVLNGQMAVRQAKKRKHSQESELALYIVHCLLHNLGYSDRTSGQGRKMHKIEDEILQQQGYGLVYCKQPRRRTLK